MENASKALIIAGAVLITIIILSLSILVFNKFGGSAKNMANMDDQEVAAFNSKITPYIGNSISGSQVNALLQYCLSSNISEQKKGRTNRLISAEYKDKGGTSFEDAFERNGDNTCKGYIRVSTGKGEFYKVEVEVSGEGLYTTIKITHN